MTMESECNSVKVYGEDVGVYIKRRKGTVTNFNNHNSSNKFFQIKLEIHRFYTIMFAQFSAVNISLCNNILL